jgi:hypothetical protein
MPNPNCQRTTIAPERVLSGGSRQKLFFLVVLTDVQFQRTTIAPESVLSGGSKNCSF